MKKSKRAIIWVAALAIAGLGATVSIAQKAPFGNAEDIDYAAKLWKAMEAAHMAGPGAINTLPFWKRFIPRQLLVATPAL